MRPQVIAVAVIWLLVLGDAVRQGLNLPFLPHASTLRFDAFGVFAVLMPIAFFWAMGYWIKGYPFDVPPLRSWVNSRFGDSAYERFCRNLKLTLLFAIAGFLIGGIGLLRAYTSGAAEGAFVVGSFFVAAAIGFLLLRTVLAKRGLSFE
jgi:hypothetical protein